MSSYSEDRDDIRWSDISESLGKKIGSHYATARQSARTKFTIDPTTIPQGLVLWERLIWSKFPPNDVNFQQLQSPLLLVALKAALPSGEAAVLRAVRAAAWLEIAASTLNDSKKPLAPLIAALENAPDGASDDELQEVLVSAFMTALKSADARTSYQTIGGALDIWLQHILGEPRDSQNALDNGPPAKVRY